MVEKLIGALALSMKEKWDDTYRVYTESVFQSAEKPCFFIECENAEQVGMLGGRFFVRVTLKITLDSNSEEKKYEADEIMGDMFTLMNSVVVENVVLHGRGINAKWEKGNLVIRGCYDIFMSEEKADGDMMLSIEADRKGVK